MPSIHNKMFAFQFICMWPSISRTRDQSDRLAPSWSLVFGLPCAFAFAFTLAVAYGTLIIVESSSRSILFYFLFYFTPLHSFCFVSLTVCVCVYFFNALWIIDWDRGLRGPSITLFVYMIILDCPLRGDWERGRERGHWDLSVGGFYFHFLLLIFGFLATTDTHTHRHTCMHACYFYHL